MISRPTLKRSRWPILVVTAVCVFAFATADSRGTYQTPDEFLAEIFDGGVPSARRLWIGDEMTTAVRRILDHDLGRLRVRYWARAARTVWILDEIGKERPITTGIVIDQGKLEQLKVLAFRESRGGEVRYPFFTDQFRGAGLTEGAQLDRAIDGISGATLSVRALTKLARLALFFDQQTRLERSAQARWETEALDGKKP